MRISDWSSDVCSSDLNFFLPHGDTGTPLSNLDYAYIAAELGKSPLASESLNCSAPATGNMEVLEMVGTPGQKDRWLKPRSEERRVGKECVSTCSSRGARYH